MEERDRQLTAPPKSWIHPVFASTWQQEAVHNKAAVSSWQHYNAVAMGWAVGVGVGHLHLHLKLRHRSWR
jgi:hypothetical protein